MVDKWHFVQVSVWRVDDERSQVCIKFSTNGVECGFINKDFCTHEIAPYVCPFGPNYADANSAIRSRSWIRYGNGFAGQMKTVEFFDHPRVNYEMLTRTTTTCTLFPGFPVCTHC